MGKSKFSIHDESYPIAKQGVAEFITQIVKSDNAEEKVNKFALDEMIAHIDDVISEQMDEKKNATLHTEDHQEVLLNLE